MNPAVLLALQIVFWGTGGLILFIYVGYPLLLAMLPMVLGRRRVQVGDGEPSVTLVISAYNEEAVIGKKIENSLALDYPKAKLQILVVDDASSDRTPSIVKEFEGRGVELLSNPGRMGKTWGLNRAVERAAGEFLLFSDANIMYRPDALRKMARNFADPTVGCVTGESRYILEARSQVGSNEDLYWRFESFIKVLETARGSMVGSDGAIFMLRKALYQSLDPEDINDFLIPLRVVLGRHRNIYEPEAIGEEGGTEEYVQEYRRKIRIVSRSWRVIRKCLPLLNPLRFGFFSVQLFAHKVLRWCMGFWLILLLGASAALRNESWPHFAAFWGQVGFYAWAVLGGLVLRRLRLPGFTTLPYYFCVVNAAATLGVIKGSLGKVQATWEPQARKPLGAAGAGAGAGGSGFSLLRLAAILSLAAGCAAAMVAWRPVAAGFVWASAAVPLYVYIGYPILLRLLAILRRRTVRKVDGFPSLVLVVPAYNEAKVIRQKMQNCLALDYPKDRLQVVVVSDGSTDGTSEIVESFRGDGIRLMTQAERRGKAAALAAAVRESDAEIFAFSDANVLYEPSALRMLVRNFADPDVGGVTGKVKLINHHLFYRSSEDLYYNYEERLFRNETSSGTMIGVDGAMYAVRRELFRPPPAAAILDDFWIGMEIVWQKKRVVFEPEALGYEVSAPSAEAEFDRKARLVAGAVQYLLGSGHPRWSDPFLPRIQYFSHKVMRWLTPVFLLCMLGGSALLAREPIYLCLLLAQAAFYATAAVGYFWRHLPGPLVVPFYFCMVNSAAMVGLFRGLTGRTGVFWRSHERLPMPELESVSTGSRPGLRPGSP